MTRAFYPWPGTWTNWQSGKTCLRRQVKIISVSLTPLKINDYKIGQTFLDNDQLAVQCGENALIIKKLQPEGKKEITAEEFLRGYKNIVDQILD